MHKCTSPKDAQFRKNEKFTYENGDAVALDVNLAAIGVDGVVTVAGLVNGLSPTFAPRLLKKFKIRNFQKLKLKLKNTHVPVAPLGVVMAV